MAMASQEVRRLAVKASAKWLEQQVVWFRRAAEMARTAGDIRCARNSRARERVYQRALDLKTGGAS
jgi:hypothetical protein